MCHKIPEKKLESNSTSLDDVIYIYLGVPITYNNTLWWMSGFWTIIINPDGAGSLPVNQLQGGLYYSIDCRVTTGSMTCGAVIISSNVTSLSCVIH